MRLADYDTPGLVTGNTATLSLLGKDQSLPTAGIAAALEKVFDGFYTLVVTTADSMAVVRDPIACKPGHHRRNQGLRGHGLRMPRPGIPAGIEAAHIFEPEPGKGHTWSL
jgi:hypothetical protein